MIPPTVDDGIGRELPRTLGPMRLSLAAVIVHSGDPLILSGDGPRQTDVAIVENQTFLAVAAALGLGERFQVSLAVPMALAQFGHGVTIEGEQVDPPGDLKLADPVLGAAFCFIGDAESVFQAGLSLSGNVPVGSQDDFVSDGGPSGALRLLLAVNAGPIVASLSAGGRYRPDRELADDVAIGTELVSDAGLYYRIFPELMLGAEVFVATSLDHTFDEGFTPVEALGGLHYRGGAWSATIGMGGGLTESFGAPDVRGVASFGWSPVKETPRRRVVTPVPTDGDRDGDGVLDSRDGCPEQPEDVDQHDDADGCPDPDNDGDGIADGADRCPNEAEDADQHDDADGCPDPDNDDDGIPDATDQCPNEPESRNGVADEDGCPEARIEGGQVQITQRVEFEVNGDVLRSSSFPILEEVARILREHAELRIRVDGHTDDTGTERTNLSLSRRRAEAVVRWLVAHGVDRGRLESQGFGSTRPLEQATTDEARQRNRRVEFNIVE